jgi:hypothetical protein
MQHIHQRRTRRWATAAALVICAMPAAAQTDYYNTDAGRPITVEDAYAIERRAVEIQLAPLRLSRDHGGIYTWAIEPAVAIGVLPRTQLEIGVPLLHVDRGAGGGATGLGGIDLSLLYNLNAETALPALGVVADLLLPVGAMASDDPYPSLKGIATKTFSWARFHANAQYTFAGRTVRAHGLTDAPVTDEISRWMAGLAVDRTFPLHSLLLTAEVVARQPLPVGDEVSWSTGAGLRYQIGPRLAADAGAGYRLTTLDRGWFVTFGGAVSVGLPWSSRRAAQ